MSFQRYSGGFKVAIGPCVTGRLQNDMEPSQKTLLDKFAALQKTCSDPFNINTKSVKTTLKEMTLDSIRKYDSRLLFSATLISGKKICKRCEMKPFHR